MPSRFAQRHLVWTAVLAVAAACTSAEAPGDAAPTALAVDASDALAQDGDAAAGAADSATSDGAALDSAALDSAALDSASADHGGAEVAGPDITSDADGTAIDGAADLDAADPDAAPSDSAEPDTAEPDTAEPDTAEPGTDGDGALASDAAADLAASDLAPGDGDASAEVLSPAVVWQGKFSDAAPTVGFSLQLPAGVAKGADQGSWPPMSLALIDDVDGDAKDDLVLATQGGALAVAYGPLTAATPLQPLPASGNADPRIHALAVLRRPNQAPILLTGGSPMAAWQLQGQGWVNVATALGIAKPAAGLRYGVTPVDLDGDGLLDLLLSDLKCQLPGKHLAWLDRGDGIFVPADPLEFPGTGAQWGAIAGDWDDDGDLDVVWMHDGCGNPKTTQGFFRQLPRGADGWPVYERQQPHSLFAFPQAPVPYASPMGAAAVDLFGQGQIGLAIANTGLSMPLATAKALLLGVDEADIFNVQNLLLVPQAGGALLDVGAAAGLKALVSPPTKLDMQAWAMVPLDVDADGRQDLAVAHAAEPLGFVMAAPGPTRPVLLHNQGQGKLVEVSAAVGLPAPLTAPILAAGDLDGDGDTDLALGRLGEPVLLLANHTQTTGQRLRLRLRGQTSNPAAIGARVTAQVPGGAVSRWVGVDAPFASHLSHAVELGIGVQPAAAVTIHWPSGYVQQLASVAAGAQLSVDEPSLVQLSARRVGSGATIAVTVTPRDPAGQPLAVAAQAEIVQIAPAFTWKTPLTCQAGSCSGVLQAEDVATATTAFLHVSWPGTDLKVWPRLTALP